MSITAMRQALEALEWNLPVIEDYGDKEQLNRQHRAITALRTAIEQAEKQEPAPGYCKHCKQYTIEEPLPAAPLQDAQPLRGAMPWEQLYPQFERATPPAAQRQWVGLTDEDCKGMNVGDMVVAMWADRILKEKNNAA